MALLFHGRHRDDAGCCAGDPRLSLERLERHGGFVDGCGQADAGEGIKGAEATAVCVFFAQQGKSKDEIKAYVREHYYPLDFTLDEIRPGYSFDVSCQGSVPQALEAFFESTSFEDAIRNAISIGGDSDTIGAICGAVAEAFYGVSDEIRAKAMTFLSQHLADVLKRVEDAF